MGEDAMLTADADRLSSRDPALLLADRLRIGFWLGLASVAFRALAHLRLAPTALQPRLYELKTVGVRLDAADTGIGIPLPCRATVLDMFQQVDATDPQDERGSGLGLAIAAPGFRFINPWSPRLGQREGKD